MNFRPNPKKVIFSLIPVAIAIVSYLGMIFEPAFWFGVLAEIIVKFFASPFETILRSHGLWLSVPHYWGDSSDPSVVHPFGALLVGLLYGILVYLAISSLQPQNSPHKA